MAGNVRDYTRKQSLEDSVIVGWASGDRGELWRAAESAERRKDAVLAREVLINLPEATTPAQRLAIVREFSEELNNKYGVAVDACIHRPGKLNDKNWHAHIMFSPRAVAPDGKSFAKLKDQGWGDKYESAKRIKALRTKAGEIIRRVAGVSGPEWDERSYKEQGVDKTPRERVTREEFIENYEQQNRKRREVRGSIIESAEAIIADLSRLANLGRARVCRAMDRAVKRSFRSRFGNKRDRVRNEGNLDKQQPDKANDKRGTREVVAGKARVAAGRSEAKPAERPGEAKPAERPKETRHATPIPVPGTPLRRVLDDDWNPLTASGYKLDDETEVSAEKKEEPDDDDEESGTRM